MDMDVAWSGAKFRAGECPPLSGYLGGSSLQAVLDRRVPEPVVPLSLTHPNMRRGDAVRATITQLHRDGMDARHIALKLDYSLTHVRRVIRRARETKEGS